MFQAAFKRDGVEALFDSIGAADDDRAILLFNLALDGGGGGKNPGSCLTEDLKQGRIFKLPDDLRPEVVYFKPVIERTAQRRTFERQQERRAIQGGGKVLAEADG